MPKADWLEQTRKHMQELANNPEFALGATSKRRAPHVTASYSFPPIPEAGKSYRIEPGETVCGFTNNGSVTVVLNVG